MPTRPICRSAADRVLLTAGCLILSATWAAAQPDNPPRHAISRQADLSRPACEWFADGQLLPALLPVVARTHAALDENATDRPAQLLRRPGPGTLEVFLADPHDPQRHFINLFLIPSDRWPGPPVFFDIIPANRPTTLTGVPPGRYHVLALEHMSNRNRTILSIGLPPNWPQPISIKSSDDPARVTVVMSPLLTRHVRRKLHELEGTITSARAKTAEAVGAHGRVLTADSRPAIGAHVQLRATGPRDGRWPGEDTFTDQAGHYRIEPVDYAYTLGAGLTQPLADAPGWRSLWRHEPQTYLGPAAIDVKLPDWPTARECGTLIGTVVDADGAPLPAFSVRVTRPPTSIALQPAQSPDDEVLLSWNVNVAATDGRFRVANLPAGTAKVQITGLPPMSTSGRLFSEEAEIRAGEQTSVRVQSRRTLEQMRPASGAPIGTIVGSARPTSPAQPAVEVRAGQPAPDFEVKTLGGRTLRSADLRGKLVLLNFWATYCPPCMAEMPVLVELERQYGRESGPLVIIGLSSDQARDTITACLAQNDYTWAQVHAGPSKASRLHQRFAVRGIPESILIDRDGTIVARNLTHNAIRWAVERALNE